VAYQFELFLCGISSNGSMGEIGKRWAGKYGQHPLPFPFLGDPL